MLTSAEYQSDFFQIKVFHSSLKVFGFPFPLSYESPVLVNIDQDSKALIQRWLQWLVEQVTNMRSKVTHKAASDNRGNKEKQKSVAACDTLFNGICDASAH